MVNFNRYFDEKLNSNLSPIKDGLCTPNLKIEAIKVNSIDKSIALIYLKNTASRMTLKVIRSKLKEINISSAEELQSYLLNNLSNKTNIFPLIRGTKRRDWAHKALYKGEVLILIEGEAVGLIAPRSLGKVLLKHTLFPNSIPGVSRTLVYIALIVSLCLSSLYLGIVSYHIDTLSVNFIAYFTSIPASILFSTFLEVVILELVVEMLREALFTIPPKTVLSIAVMGTIAIGQNLIYSALFNPLLVLIVSSSFLMSCLIPDYITIHSLRILKITMIIATGMFGIYGFSLIMTLIILNIIILTRSGIPYTPFTWYELIHAFLWEAKKRLITK